MAELEVATEIPAKFSILDA